MDQPEIGKFCPQCRQQVPLYDKVCPQCGHQFRTGIGLSLEASTPDLETLNKTQMFIALSPDLPAAEAEPPTAPAWARPGGRRVPIVLALGVGLALLAAVLIFLWLLKLVS